MKNNDKISIIHPTAIIHPSAQLGEGVQIGAFAVIEENVLIGRECQIHAHAIIRRNTQMGQGNIIHSFAVIGGTPQVRGDEDLEGSLIIGNNNAFHEYCTVNRGYTKLTGMTILGHENILMTSSHVGHDCRLNDRITLVNGVCLAGSVLVDTGANLSANCLVHQFCRIGRLSFVSANSLITMDLLPFFLYSNHLGKPKSMGLNSKGLKRAKMTDQDLSLLKNLYKQLIRKRAGSSEYDNLMASLPSCYIEEVFEFIKKSQRGWYR